MRSTIATAIAVGLAWIMAACGSPRECTLMACSDTLSIDFEPAFSEPGEYQVEVSWERETMSCLATIPFEPGSDRCESKSGKKLDGGLVIGRSTAGPIKGVWVSSAPSSLEITVRRDGLVLASSPLEPSYDRHHPNGEECDGDFFCQVAKTKLVSD